MAEVGLKQSVSFERAREMLSPEIFSDLVAELPVAEGRRPVEAELVTLWVKPGRHFNVYYKLRFDDDRTVHAAAFLLSPDKAARVVRRATRRHVEKLARRGVCPHCATQRMAEDLVLQVFPIDYRLPTLADCLRPKAVIRSSAGAIEAKECVPVAYRPGIRCQIRIREKDGRVCYGKVAVESRGAGRGYRLHETAYKALAARDSFLRVAPPRAYLEPLGMAVVDGVEGTRYHDLLRSGDDVQDATSLVARASFELHRLDVRWTDRTYNVTEEMALVASWVDLVSELYPDLSYGLRRWHEYLLIDPPPDCSARAVLHRDFYDKQVLLDGDRPVLLDMDTVCAGDAELDVGNFRAHLYLRGLQWGRDDRFVGLEHAFVRAYPGLLSER
ncbi:MAG: hypothetical protein D6760_08480, partial [Deltaproteobacteria bacterium]